MSRKKVKYMTIKEAADFLKTSISTLRSWDKSKILKARRGKGNAYRLYSITELQKFRESHKRKYNKTKKD